MVKHKQTGKNFAAKQFKKKRLLKHTGEVQLLFNEITVMKTLGANDFTSELFEVYETEKSVYLILEYL